MSTASAPGGVPPTWAPPPSAVGPWLALQAAVAGLASARPVCAAPVGSEDWWAAPRQVEALGRAVAGCSSCPLAGPCGLYAVAAREPHGVWGGLTVEDRRGAV